MKYIVSLFSLVLFQIQANTCTTFFINKNGQMVFGRNYDWITDAGMLNTNLKGLSKTAAKNGDGETISWVSQYGSITFNQYGKEFPTGGMNEKGLVVELMWLEETQYPAPDNRPAVGVLQWIQYQLDNCATIDEVIATDKKLRIASTGNTPLHYLVADANGNAAAIEFLEGKMVVHKGTDLSLPVLTNSTYAQSVKTYTNSTTGGSARSFTDGNNSLERFGQVCNKLQQLKEGEPGKPMVDFAFDILGEVAQGEFTRWSIVYDIRNRVIHFKTQRFPVAKSISFSAVDFTCSAAPKMWDLNQGQTGDISKKLQDYSQEMNQKLVETAFKESSSQLRIDDKLKRAVWQYPASVSCQ